jgi:methyltransferase (TIGR00027 family)
MKIPNDHNALKVGRLRHIQFIHEKTPHKNPDYLVGQLLPLSQRWGAKWISAKELNALRLNFFYYYLSARTHYYDQLFRDAIERGVRSILNVGSGTDTRAYRFADDLERKGIVVCECDQPVLIQEKESKCRRRWPSAPVTYLPLDLNDSSWPLLDSWLDANANGDTFVLMEGITPYVAEQSVGRFLEMLAHKLSQGSIVAYDFKLRDVDDGFGTEASEEQGFRLAANREEVAQYHLERNYRLTHMELSDALSVRFLGDLTAAGFPMFREDGLVQVELLPHSSARTDGRSLNR